MSLLSDSTLSSLSWWFQWGAVWTALASAILASLLIFVRAESSSRVTKRLNTAEQTAVTAQSVANALKQKQRPRSLSEESKNSFSKLSKQIPSIQVGVRILSMNLEAVGYGRQIRQLFDQNGIIGPYADNIMGLNFETPQHDDIAIIVRHASARADWQPLALALKESGISTGVINDENNLFHLGESEIIIAVKDKHLFDYESP